VKFSWNPWKTESEPDHPLSEPDSARLRRLELTINDMASDLEICLKAIPKINARLRQRAVREAEDDEEVAEPAVEASFSAQSNGVDKNSMRALARTRGLMR
jgi:hypothetical protein